MPIIRRKSRPDPQPRETGAPLVAFGPGFGDAEAGPRLIVVGRDANGNPIFAPVADADAFDMFGGPPPDPRRDTALHEAAHAVVATAVEIPVMNVMIFATSGETRFAPVPVEFRIKDRDANAITYLTNRVLATLAGRHGPPLEGGWLVPLDAELTLSGLDWDDGHLGDVVFDARHAWELLARMEPAFTLARFEELSDRARQLVQDHAAEVVAVADVLVSRARLAGVEVQQIMEGLNAANA